MDNIRKYLSIPEAAAILGISRIAVFKKVKKGRLAAIRVGRNWAIPVEALTAPAIKPAKPAAAGSTQKKSRQPAPEIIPARVPPLEKDFLDEMGWD